MAVADASVLIALAKVGRLGLLNAVLGLVRISPEVKREVVDRGLEVSAPEVRYVQQAINEGWIRTARLTSRERSQAQTLITTTTLDGGEAESIAMARARDQTLVADDKEARIIARSLGVEVVGCLGVLFEAFRTGKIDLIQMEDVVKDLCEVLWLSPTIVADILKRARELSE